jgi:acetyltransferase-like isoleucine patch superfamily enzyme
MSDFPSQPAPAGDAMSFAWATEARVALSRLRQERGLAVVMLQRVIGWMRAAALFRRSQLGARVCATGKVSVLGAEGITLGHRVTFFGGMIASELACAPGATLEIGDECGFNYGVSIAAHQSIRIGRRCMFASFVRVSDAGRAGVQPVEIGDDVWLAHAAIVEPGVRIGNGSVVAAGSVVTQDIPPHSLAIGNPARAVPLDVIAPAVVAAAVAAAKK